MLQVVQTETQIQQQGLARLHLNHREGVRAKSFRFTKGPAFVRIRHRSASN